jgi:hypothetical protein
MFAPLRWGKPVRVTERSDNGGQHLPLVGMKVGSHTAAPHAGTWEIIDHPDCDADGMLRALTRHEIAPLCPVCDHAVRWQLTHLAPNVAADHRGVGRLP